MNKLPIVSDVDLCLRVSQTGLYLLYYIQKEARTPEEGEGEEVRRLTAARFF
jgi:hypothetical protein